MRPTSLKGLIPHLAKSLGLTPAAIYERQRALVRVGLLEPRPGRGPGSGVPADAQSVAILFTSLLALGGLSEVEAKTKGLANLKSKTGKCPITGKRTFVAALSATLSSDELLSKVLYVSARRSGPETTASIVFLISSPPRADERYRSDFGSLVSTHYLATFAYLTLEATINIQWALRGIELGTSK